MILKKLNIIDFKSIEAANLEFSDKLNCFVGLNGMGKTNILDAIHYLSFTKSHLGLPDALAIRKGRSSALLDAYYQDKLQDLWHIMLQVQSGKRKVLKRNKKEYGRLAEHIGQIPLVIVSPQDHHLTWGGSEGRRRFLDQQLSQENAKYLGALSSYNRLLEQRNSLLKSGQSAPMVFQVLDEQLSQFARYIHQERRAFVERFVPIFNDYYHQIDGGNEEVFLVYRSQLIETNGELLPLLRASFDRDKILGYTSVGIHKDDLDMLLEEALIRKVGSEGQNKTYLISLKLAQYKALSQHHREQPILLLDDIFDKLDAERVERIISLVGGADFGQIFITDTNRDHLDEIIRKSKLDFRLFRAEKGHFTSIGGTDVSE